MRYSVARVGIGRLSTANVLVAGESLSMWAKTRAFMALVEYLLGA